MRLQLPSKYSRRFVIQLERPLRTVPSRRSLSKFGSSTHSSSALLTSRGTMALRAALVALLPAVAAAEKYAVIAAGSSGFMNYRHQADACHAYQLMLQSGVPADNIILMMQDDVANSEENPFPGQLFNKPGENPPDVYKGCKVDYSGDIVTGKLFMDVLTGNTQGAKGKVLKSGASDTVFVNFVDHGGPGIIAFPNGPVLTVKELSQTLKTMESKQMFKQMVFYMEACESGSMFPDLKADVRLNQESSQQRIPG